MIVVCGTMGACKTIKGCIVFRANYKASRRSRTASDGAQPFAKEDSFYIRMIAGFIARSGNVVLGHVHRGFQLRLLQKGQFAPVGLKMRATSYLFIN